MTIKTNNLVKRTALVFVLAAIAVPAAQAATLADVHDRQGATRPTADGDALDRNIANALRDHSRGSRESGVALDRNIANALRDHARASLRELASRDAVDRFRAAGRRGGR